MIWAPPARFARAGLSSLRDHAALVMQRCGASRPCGRRSLAPQSMREVSFIPQTEVRLERQEPARKQTLDIRAPLAGGHRIAPTCGADEAAHDRRDGRRSPLLTCRLRVATLTHRPEGGPQEFAQGEIAFTPAVGSWRPSNCGNDLRAAMSAETRTSANANRARNEGGCVYAK